MLWLRENFLPAMINYDLIRPRHQKPYALAEKMVHQLKKLPTNLPAQYSNEQRAREFLTGVFMIAAGYTQDRFDKHAQFLNSRLNPLMILLDREPRDEAGNPKHPSLYRYANVTFAPELEYMEDLMRELHTQAKRIAGIKKLKLPKNTLN